MALRVAQALALAGLIGCHGNPARYVPPETPMPPNTILLSEMMRELSAKPGFTEAMLAELDKGGKKGPALLTPALIRELRSLILGRNWEKVDRFPGWTMHEINPTVRVVGHFAGKEAAVASLASRHPGSPAEDSSTQTQADLTQTMQLEAAFVDLGAYALDKPAAISLDEPSRLPGFSSAGLVSTLGDGVVRGDDANPERALLHAESQRLADVLNRLTLNGLDGVPQAHAQISVKEVTSAQDLVRALAESGHTIEIADARYFANFGHFHFKGQDVMMPFWVNTEIVVPGAPWSAGRPLLVPVSHAEYEWRIRGPKINADVSWYYGVDGKAEFRTMDTLDQAWVLGRHAHTYRDADALEVTRLVEKMEIAYAHQHAARPKLPFGGYYALGVCQDSVAAIEKKMTGKATLFPNTADAALFDDPRDTEVNTLMAAIPKDRAGRLPEPERIFGSLPVAESELQSITIPGLAADLIATQQAWHAGRLERTHGWRRTLLEVILGIAALMLLGRLMQAVRSRR
jgi:hypothetical protein